MEKFIVKGGRPLCGEVEIQSAKNAVLPLLAASVLTDEKIIIHKCPRFADVLNMVQILGELGCKTQFDGDDLTIDPSDAANHEIPSALAKELRSSVFMLGSVIARFGRARIAYPGGCDIGLRPIGLHLNGLRRLGVCVSEGGGYIDCSCGRIEGAEIVLDFPSVGATENIILAAAKAKGTTLIRNAAKEPEIVDLAHMLNEMGAKIEGAGTNAIGLEVEQGSSLPSSDFLRNIVHDSQSYVVSQNLRAPMEVIGTSNYGWTDYGDTDYGPENDGVTDYYDSDYGALNDGVTDYASDYGESAAATTTAPSTGGSGGSSGGGSSTSSSESVFRQTSTATSGRAALNRKAADRV